MSKKDQVYQYLEKDKAIKKLETAVETYLYDQDIDPDTTMISVSQKPNKEGLTITFDVVYKK